jgi:hypothetical protein
MNRVPKRTFGPKRKEVTFGWRKLQYEGLPNSNPSPKIICVVKSSRMRWVRECRVHGRDEKCIQNSSYNS